MNITSRFEYKSPVWKNIVILTLGFWLSASLLLDWVIMPSLYISGMMTQASFASAGYLVFWNFNRIELLSAAVVLTGILAITKTQADAFKSIDNKPLQWLKTGAIVFAVILLAVSLANTYLLSPQMSATGIQLRLFAETSEVPTGMNLLHGMYWSLEGVKLFVGSFLLGWCWKN
ncbi:MAG: hypothetical protein AAF208_12585 [Cyanobacteria bacterium P01_A01_bin.45]